MQYDVIARPYGELEEIKCVTLVTKDNFDDARKAAEEARSTKKWKYVCIREHSLPSGNN